MKLAVAARHGPATQNDAQSGRKKNLTCLLLPTCPGITITDKDLQPRREMKMEDVPVSCKASDFRVPRCFTFCCAVNLGYIQIYRSFYFFRESK